MKSIEDFVCRFDKNAPQVFKIGVGFWANKKFTIDHIKQLAIDSLDYFIFIKSDQTSWKIFCTGRMRLFTKTEGKVDLPEIYEVVVEDRNQLGLF